MTAETAAERALGPGATLGRYRLVRVLGEGATGTVFLAERLPGESSGEGSVHSAAHVALKVIHRHLVRDRQVSARFFREASILRRLRGEHVVGLLDFGELDDGLLYMAQELAEGQGLELLVASGPVAPERAVRLVQHICRALETAHAAGIVHRDLKPSNVIVETTAAGGERARVLDFGMAKVLRGDGSDSLTALTEQNMVFGTPEYMAPEQARGDEVDARCDVYAAGVILYELLTGGVPFTAPTPIGVMTAHLVQQPAPPSRRVPGITPALEAVVLHALAKERSARYPTAASLAEALELGMRRPLDVAGTLPPPSAEDELAVRDTEHALRLDPALRRTEPGAPPRIPGQATGRGWLLWAFLAALVGTAVGVALSL